MMRVVLRKELLELRRSPVLLLSMASLPLVVVAVPVLLLAWLVHAAPEQALASIKDLYDVHAPGGPVVAIGAILAVKWLPMFLVLPIFLPILVAAQSIGGERERRTLEPLLATPVSTLAIVLGKSIAARTRFSPAGPIVMTRASGMPTSALSKSSVSRAPLPQTRAASRSSGLPLLMNK